MASRRGRPGSGKAHLGRPGPRDAASGAPKSGGHGGTPWGTCKATWPFFLPGCLLYGIGGGGICLRVAELEFGLAKNLQPRRKASGRRALCVCAAWGGRALPPARCFRVQEMGVGGRDTGTGWVPTSAPLLQSAVTNLQHPSGHYFPHIW